jgi:hypothetical protein
MPWHCPACQTIIRHNEFEERPRLGIRYRCPVCRLELIADERTAHLAVAPIENDTTDHRERPTK